MVIRKILTIIMYKVNYMKIPKTVNIKAPVWDNSKYWLGDHLTADDSIDILKLAGVHRSIGNFVRIVTGKDVPVKFSTGDDSYTDGKSVVIAGKISDKQFDSTVGLALHEGSHIAFTDFKILRDFMYKDDKKYPRTSDLKSLLNIIEDRRIDYIVYTTAPGYREYYKAMYNEYFNDAIIDSAIINNWKIDETWDNYIFHICNFTNPNRNLKALRNLQKIWDTLDLRNIGRLKTTADAMEVAKAIYKLIDEAVTAAATNATSKPKPSKSKPQSSDNKASSNENANSNEKSDDKSNEKSDDKSSDKSDDNSNEKSDGDEYTVDEDNLDLPPADSDDEDNSDFESPQPQTPISANQLKELEDALKEQQKFLDGELKKSKLNKNKASQAETIASDNIDITSVGSDLASESYRKSAKSTRCIVVNKLTRDILNTINVCIGDPDEVIANINSKWGSRYYNSMIEGIRMGTQLANKLKLRSESVELKSTRLPAGKIDKRLLSGLGFGMENVFEKINVQTNKPVIIHLSIDASGSMSGSKGISAIRTAAAISRAVRDIPNIDIVITTRACIRLASNDYPLLVTIYDSRKDPWSHLQTWLPCVEFSSSTPEGLCFEALEKSMSSVNQSADALFVNISDGEPTFTNSEVRYFGETAREHTRKQVQKIRNKGFKVLSYFVSDTNYAHTRRAFKYMYSDSAQFVNVENLNVLAKTLNEILLAPAYALR